ncbi:MAG: cation:proton antiporter [Desulfobulbaceae bacterium]|nr:cation:proton antiporter [Desulfobulbaceae bacterium]
MEFSFQPHALVYVGLLLLLSYLGGEIASYCKAPRVTGYLVMGMLVGHSVIGLFPRKMVQQDLVLVTHIALSIIAFSIGGSLNLGKMKRLGRQILLIAVNEAGGAFVLVTLVLCLGFWVMPGVKGNFLTVYFPLALVVGALSAATAPAATLAIIHEYRARGPMTTIVLGVVALDDALAIFFFAFAGAIARSLVQGQGVSWQAVTFMPVFALLASLAIGAILGAALSRLMPFVKRRAAMLGVITGAILLASGLALSLGVSPLLADMALGFAVTNFVGRQEDIFAVVESIEEPLFGMFFALAGAHLDLEVIGAAAGLALLIILGRFSGKLIGCRIGAWMSGAPREIRTYLGFCLMPKAGVTVGLILVARDIFGLTAEAELMVNAVLGSVIINELLAPFGVRYALFRTGEAGAG